MKLEMPYENPQLSLYSLSAHTPYRMILRITLYLGYLYHRDSPTQESNIRSFEGRMAQLGSTLLPTSSECEKCFISFIPQLYEKQVENASVTLKRGCTGGVALDGREWKPIEERSQGRDKMGIMLRSRRTILLCQKWAGEERTVKSKTSGEEKKRERKGQDEEPRQRSRGGF